jgi:PQQ-like domain
MRNQQNVLVSDDRFGRTALRRAMPLLFMAVAMMASLPLRGQGTSIHPVWNVREDLGGNEFSAGVATDGLQAFTVGTSDPSPTIDCINQVYNAVGCRMIISARSVLTGAQRWSVVRSGVADAVALNGSVVLVAGNGIDITGTQVFEVLALDAFSGRILWDNEYKPSGALGSAANAIAVQGNMVYAGGVVTTGPNFGQTDYLVRAYNLSTGVSVWQDRSPAGGFYDLITSIAVQGTRVIAVGGRFFNFIARAYDTQTGALAWQNTFDSGFGFDEAKFVVINGTRAFVAGEASKAGPDDRNTFLRAYDVVTGSVLWSSQIDSGPFDFLSIADSSADKVFVTGTGGPNCGFFTPGHCKWLVRAHDAKTGTVVWEDWFDTSAPINQGTAIVAQANRVYVAGQVGQDCTDVCDYSLKVLDSSTGKVVAQDYYDNGGDDFGFWLAASPFSLIAAGSSQNSKGDYDFLIRSYWTLPLFF